jgi:hypothetical protein
MARLAPARRPAVAALGNVLGEDAVRRAGLVADLGLDADIVVRELAHLGVVHAQDLRLIVAAQAEEAHGEVVHRPEDEGLCDASHVS